MKADGSNAPQKTGGGVVATQERKAPPTIYEMLSSESMKKQIGLALPKHVTPERLTRIAVTALRQNPKLARCSQGSLLGAIMNAAQLGLEPNTPLGLAYLIPYKSEATFQLGYKGILDLAYRTGEYQVIYAMEVYAQDEFHFQYGLNPDLVHVPADNASGDPTHYYAVYKRKDGGTDFRVWSAEKVLQHAKKFSKSFANNDSPWQSDFPAMAKKTVLIDLLKYAQKSVEFAKDISKDGVIAKANTDDFTIEAEYEIPDHDEPEERTEKLEAPGDPGQSQ